MIIELTDREVAIVSAALSRCLGWDDPAELQRFVNIAAEHVRDGWTDAEMHAVQEKLCECWQEKSV